MVQIPQQKLYSYNTVIITYREPHILLLLFFSVSQKYLYKKTVVFKVLIPRNSVVYVSLDNLGIKTVMNHLLQFTLIVIIIGFVTLFLEQTQAE